MLAPCFIGDVSDYYPDLTEAKYKVLASSLSSLGIESLMGPKWAVHLALICVFVGEDDELCKVMRDIPLGPLHVSGSIHGY